MDFLQRGRRFARAARAMRSSLWLQRKKIAHRKERAKETSHAEIARRMKREERKEETHIPYSGPITKPAQRGQAATLLATTKIYMIIFELKKLRENFDKN